MARAFGANPEPVRRNLTVPKQTPPQEFGEQVKTVKKKVGKKAGKKK